jgi:hypothetical protein
MPLQIRRGTNAERLILASPLVSGELLWIVDDQRLYIGDGTTLARDLLPVTGFNAEDAQDTAASLFTAGSHTGITFVYEDANDRVNATVNIPQLLQNLDLNNFSITGTGNIAITGDLSITGNITGDYKGSLFADDSTLLVNGIDGSINLDGTVKGDVVPDQNEAYDLGSTSNRFKDLYLSGTSLYLGSAQITASGAAVNLPAGSTINGVLISDIESGVAAGNDYNINIVGDDSSSIINSSSRTVTASGGFFGNLTGDVKGSIFGDDSTKIVDAVANEVYAAGGFFGNLTTDNITGTNIILNSLTTTQTNQFFITNDNSNNDSNLSIRKNTNAGNFGARMTLFRSTGTDSVPVSVAQNDVLSVISSGGHDGVDFTSGAAITTVVDAAVSPGIVPSSVLFSTMNSAGNFAGRGRFNSNGTFELFQPLFMARTDINNDFMILQQFTTSINDSANVTFTRARGTQAAPIIANPNDAIIDLAAAAFDGVTYTGSSTIRMNIDGTVSSGIVPGRIEFWTADLTGVQTKKAQFNRDGILEVDQIRSFNSSLTITGDLIGSVFSDASTMLIDGTNGAIKYYPGTSGDWSASAPTTVGEALDRLATVVKALNGGTGA